MLMPARMRITVAALALLATGAHAAMVSVTNPGFEADVNAPNTFTFGAPTGWLPYNTQSVENESIGTLNPSTTTYFPSGAPEGNNVAIAFIQDFSPSGTEFGINQVLSATLQPNTIYTLTVEVGNIASGFSDLGGGDTFFDLDGFPGYRVELLVGNSQLVAEESNPVTDGVSILEGEFRTTSIQFDSTGVNPGLIDQPLVIQLVNLNVIDPTDPFADREVDFDNVRLDASPSVIPIPPAILLLGSGVGLLALRWRRESASPRS